MATYYNSIDLSHVCTFFRRNFPFFSLRVPFGSAVVQPLPTIPVVQSALAAAAASAASNSLTFVNTALIGAISGSDSGSGGAVSGATESPPAALGLSSSSSAAASATSDSTTARDGTERGIRNDNHNHNDKDSDNNNDADNEESILQRIVAALQSRDAPSARAIAIAHLDSIRRRQLSEDAAYAAQIHTQQQLQRRQRFAKFDKSLPRPPLPRVSAAGMRIHP